MPADATTAERSGYEICRQCERIAMTPAVSRALMEDDEQAETIRQAFAEIRRLAIQLDADSGYKDQLLRSMRTVLGQDAVLAVLKDAMEAAAQTDEAR